MHVTSTFSIDARDEPNVNAGWGYVSISPDGKYGSHLTFSATTETGAFETARAWVALVSEKLRIAEITYVTRAALRAAEEEAEAKGHN